MIKLRDLKGTIFSFDVNEIDLLKPKFDFANQIVYVKQKAYQLSSYNELNEFGKGEKGDKGDTGDKGEKGDAGEKGENGYFEGTYERKYVSNIKGIEMIEYVSKYNHTASLAVLKAYVLNTEMMPFAELHPTGEPTILDTFSIKRNEVLLVPGTDYFFLGEYQETNRKYYKGRLSYDAICDFNHKGSTHEGKTYRYQGIVLFETNIDDTDVLTIEKIEKRNFIKPQWRVGRNNNLEDINNIKLPYVIDNQKRQNASSVSMKTFTNTWTPSKHICGKGQNTWRFDNVKDSQNNILPQSLHVDYDFDSETGTYNYGVDYLFPQFYSIYNPNKWIIEEISKQNSGKKAKRKSRKSIHVLGNEVEKIIPYKAGLYDSTMSSTKKYKQRAKQYRLRDLSNNTVTEWTGLFGSSKRYYQNAAMLTAEEKLYLFIPFFPSE